MNLNNVVTLGKLAERFHNLFKVPPIMAAETAIAFERAERLEGRSSGLIPVAHFEAIHLPSVRGSGIRTGLDERVEVVWFHKKTEHKVKFEPPSESYLYPVWCERCGSVLKGDTCSTCLHVNTAIAQLNGSSS